MWTKVKMINQKMDKRTNFKSGLWKYLQDNPNVKLTADLLIVVPSMQMNMRQSLASAAPVRNNETDEDFDYEMSVIISTVRHLGIAPHREGA